MRQNQLLLSFLPGFAPILIYIVVEVFLGESAGLAAGILLGVTELLYILFREKRVDAFTLADTALIMLIGSLGPHRFFLPYMENKMGMGMLRKAATGKPNKVDFPF
ncbi:MAG: hypothetical protein WCT14_11040 [Treponemataceae bacterium]